MEVEIKSSYDYLKYLAELFAEARTLCENAKDQYICFKYYDFYYEGMGDDVLDLLNNRYSLHLSHLMNSYETMRLNILLAAKKMKEADDDLGTEIKGIITDIGGPSFEITP